MGCLITNARHVYEVIFTKLSILFMRVSMILLARTTGKSSAESFFFLFSGLILSTCPFTSYETHRNAELLHVQIRIQTCTFCKHSWHRASQELLSFSRR